MALTQPAKPEGFKEKLLKSFIEGLAEEYKEIVKKHKEQIDREFDKSLARNITDISVYLSEKLNIADVGSTIRIEIYKPSK